MLQSFPDEIKIIRSSRKTMSIEVNKKLEVIIRAPLFYSGRKINEFYEKHKTWIEKAKGKVKGREDPRDSVSPLEAENLRKKAKEYIPERVAYFSEIMGLSYSGIKITSARGRFGSCSSKNSLCFSLYLMLYPKEAIDYVVVHELAHIVHKNHSASFYNLLKKYLPDYKEREKLLKSI